jgi:hypothetical protein
LYFSVHPFICLSFIDSFVLIITVFPSAISSTFSFLFLLLYLVQFTYEEQHPVTTFQPTKVRPSAAVSAVLLHCRIRLARIAYARRSVLSNLHSLQR